MKFEQIEQFLKYFLYNSSLVDASCSQPKTIYETKNIAKYSKHLKCYLVLLSPLWECILIHSFIHQGNAGNQKVNYITNWLLEIQKLLLFLQVLTYIQCWPIENQQNIWSKIGNFQMSFFVTYKKWQEPNTSLTDLSWPMIRRFKGGIERKSKASEFSEVELWLFKFTS